VWTGYIKIKSQSNTRLLSSWHGVFLYTGVNDFRAKEEDGMAGTGTVTDQKQKNKQKKQGSLTDENEFCLDKFLLKKKHTIA